VSEEEGKKKRIRGRLTLGRKIHLKSRLNGGPLVRNLREESATVLGVREEKSGGQAKKGKGNVGSPWQEIAGGGGGSPGGRNHTKGRGLVSKRWPPKRLYLGTREPVGEHKVQGKVDRSTIEQRVEKGREKEEKIAAAGVGKREGG